MTFEEFEQRAAADWERIPPAYRAGVDGVVIERQALGHPTLPDVYTLGECVTESYPSDWAGPETTRSLVVLYYGSFFRLARLDPAFDWEGELWETLTHELQHHLESLATDDTLVDMDYAADENFKRAQGETFDPWFYRAGERDGAWYRVEDEYFLEAAPGAGADGILHFEWGGGEYRVDAPAVECDVLILTVTAGVPDAPPGLHIVVTPQPRWYDGIRRLFSPAPVTVRERDVTASS